MGHQVIHPMRGAAWIGVFAMSGLPFAAIANAETARADLKNAGGVKVGQASLQDTSDGVKVSATFTDTIEIVLRDVRSAAGRTGSSTATGRASWFMSARTTT